MTPAVEKWTVQIPLVGGSGYLDIAERVTPEALGEIVRMLAQHGGNTIPEIRIIAVPKT